VFDRFYRGPSARQHASEGSGLGLSIAQATATRYGGSIALAPGDGGRGCRAVVTLPVIAG
jgi:signal transduction histidine kinase